MADERHLLGRAAEAAVSRWLARCGWTVVDRRRRSDGGGEVDIVALDPCGVLVAVEVRARRSRRLGAPAASVDLRRVARLRRTLASLAGETAGHIGLRVDIVTAEPAADRPGAWRLERTPGVG